MSEPDREEIGLPMTALMPNWFMSKPAFSTILYIPSLALKVLWGRTQDKEDRVGAIGKLRPRGPQPGPWLSVVHSMALGSLMPSLHLKQGDLEGCLAQRNRTDSSLLEGNHSNGNHYNHIQFFIHSFPTLPCKAGQLL
jgi:hypothetical protein